MTNENAGVGNKTELNGKLKDVLNARTLDVSFPRLAGMLRPGLRVLDAGCGTGAIASGIAAAVGPEGLASGIDSSASLIEEARARHGGTPSLTFEVADVYGLLPEETYDIVAASRLLVWLADPERALRSLAGCAAKGGTVLIADYNHEKIRWSPSPPAGMKRFYEAYLKWRSDAGLDNAIADRLPALMRAAGLQDIKSHDQHEIMRREDHDFYARAALWADTAASRGPQMARDGYGTAEEWRAAESEYRRWCAEEGESLTMYMLAVEGVKPI
ncbi:methyltransferase domain-containing protein [Cohnella sp. JJ-181]|uniref:methyltransferase domain-containing protein n=1 Tax=Cohnella rhizoplanae TaxID=2974897 RepID=UPI0022FF6ACD|nr:methyltransferase domain-containing protein [Cohnella sp. JJ-181]CAI6080485.1 tRNA 5-carboxymethoxyuridine methyltransferase [Cohnella sp. JJ-181]